MHDFDQKMIEEEVKSTKSLIQTFLQTVEAYKLYDQVGQLQLLYREKVGFSVCKGEESG